MNNEQSSVDYVCVDMDKETLQAFSKAIDGDPGVSQFFLACEEEIPLQ